jgi:quinol monooxygenase YgiN
MEYDMNNKSFTVMIAGIAKSGMEEYVKRYLIQLMEHSRKDKGCIIYNIHQSIDNPSEFMVYMLWESEAAFESHNKKPEMQEFKKQLAQDMFMEQSPKTYWHLLN